MGNRVINNYQTLIITLPTAVKINKPYYFPVDDDIASNITKGLELTYGNEISTPAIIRNELNIISGTEISNFLLFLITPDDEIAFQKQPMYAFVPYLNNGIVFKINRKIDPSKSYIQLTNTTGMAGKSIIVDWIY